METKQVIVVRKDLNMRKGKLAAQVAHASMMVLLDRLYWKPIKGDVLEGIIHPEMKHWLENSFTKIVVSCDSLDDIYLMQNRCINNNIPFAMVTDSGKTEFHGVPTITCIAVGPSESSKIDLITGEYKLL